jgi:hypothetical protein
MGHMADSDVRLGKIEYFEREGEGSTYREAYLSSGKKMD